MVVANNAFDFPYRVRVGDDIVDVLGMEIGHYAVREAFNGLALIQSAGGQFINTSGYVVDHIDLAITAVGNLQFDEAVSVADSLSLYACGWPDPILGWATRDPHIHEWLCTITLNGFVSYEAWREKRRLCRLPKKIHRIRASNNARLGRGLDAHVFEIVRNNMSKVIL